MLVKVFLHVGFELKLFRTQVTLVRVLADMQS